MANGAGVIADGRSSDAPPCDSLAEAMCLSEVILHPSRIDQVDLGPMLVFAEHRTIWHVAVRVHMRHPELLNAGEFYVEWRKEIRRLEPRNWHLYEFILFPDDESLRISEEHERAEEVTPRADHAHSFEWWLARLKRIAEARRLISAAQEIAENAWTEDVERARGIASIVATGGRETRTNADKRRTQKADTAEPIRVDV